MSRNSSRAATVVHDTLSTIYCRSICKYNRKVADRAKKVYVDKYVFSYSVVKRLSLYSRYTKRTYMTSPILRNKV
uniref:Putative ovule protein n=1 Tax=Solanum chacoense TaxID=4108 RepID=A0A0V0GV00_SOLCH